MPFCAERIEKFLEDTIREKLESYSPEDSYKPFHDNLLGKDKMTLYSIIQSINTTLGMSIYESIAYDIAGGYFESMECQKQLVGNFTDLAQKEINRIRNELSHGNASPNHAREVERLRSVCQIGEVVNKKLTRIDLYLERQGDCFAIDIKTAKPNRDGFAKQKEKMLEWTASFLYENPQANIRTVTAIPYNPSYPREYNRWTLSGIIDLSQNGELLVAEEFWNFLAGGEEIYEQLLECFFIAGRNLEWEIDKFVNECLIDATSFSR